MNGGAAYLAAAGEPVARGTVSYLRTGVALGDLVLGVPQDQPPPFGEGAAVDVVLTDSTGEDYHFAMTCFRLNVETGHWHAVLRGGAGTLDTEIPARFYQQCEGTRILADALSGCGEVLSPTASLPEPLPVYVRRRGPAFADVRALLSRYAYATWRTLPDGTYFAGAETWPAASDAVWVSQQSPQFQYVLCQPAPWVLPGMTVSDQSGNALGGVERVVHQVAEGLRTELWLGAVPS